MNNISESNPRDGLLDAAEHPSETHKLPKQKILKKYSKAILSVIGILALIYIISLIYSFQAEKKLSTLTQTKNKPAPSSRPTSSTPQLSSFQKAVNDVCHEGLTTSLEELPIRIPPSLPYAIKSIACSNPILGAVLVLTFDNSITTLAHDSFEIHIDTARNPADAFSSLGSGYGSIQAMSSNFSNSDTTKLQFTLGPLGSSYGDLIGEQFGVDLVLLGSRNDLRYGTEPLIVTSVNTYFLVPGDPRLIKLLTPYGKDHVVTEGFSKEYEKYKLLDRSSFDINLLNKAFIDDPKALTTEEKETINMVKAILESISVKEPASRIATPRDARELLKIETSKQVYEKSSLQQEPITYTITNVSGQPIYYESGCAATGIMLCDNADNCSPGPSSGCMAEPKIVMLSSGKTIGGKWYYWNDLSSSSTYQFKYVYWLEEPREKYRQEILNSRREVYSNIFSVR